VLRLFAPFLPFVSDEVWSWWHDASVHAAAWPARSELATTGDISLLAPVSDVIAAVRRAKTEAKLSQRAAVSELVVNAPTVALRAIEQCRTDLAEAGGIETFTLSEAPTLETFVRLAPSTDPAASH
jgi:valyl-tRNA synthetase